VAHSRFAAFIHSTFYEPAMPRRLLRTRNAFIGGSGSFWSGLALGEEKPPRK